MRRGPSRARSAQPLRPERGDGSRCAPALNPPLSAFESSRSMLCKGTGGQEAANVLRWQAAIHPCKAVAPEDLKGFGMKYMKFCLSCWLPAARVHTGHQGMPGHFSFLNSPFPCWWPAVGVRTGHQGMPGRSRIPQPPSPMASWERCQCTQQHVPRRRRRPGSSQRRPRCCANLFLPAHNGSADLLPPKSISLLACGSTEQCSLQGHKTVVLASPICYSCMCCLGHPRLAWQAAISPLHGSRSLNVLCSMAVCYISCCLCWQILPPPAFPANALQTRRSQSRQTDQQISCCPES